MVSETYLIFFVKTNSYMLCSKMSKGFVSEKTPCSMQYPKTFSFLFYVVLDFLFRKSSLHI